MSDDSKTKIAIYNENKFKELGYVPVRHPSGYIYFKRYDDMDNLVQTADGTFEDLSTIVSSESTHGVSSEFSGTINNTGVEANKCKLEVIDNSESEDFVDEAEQNPTPTELTPAAQSEARRPPRPVHGAFVKRWTEDISKLKFARCLLNNCNFIALRVHQLVAHYKFCPNVPFFDRNLCTKCGCWLVSSRDRDAHLEVCCSFKFGASSTVEPLSPVLEPMCYDEEIKSQKHPCPFCGKTVHHSRLKHVQTCGSSGRSGDVLSEYTVKCIWRLLEGKEPRTVIQRPPVICDGTFVKRRGYGTNHVQGWKIKFESEQCIRCSFKDCSFIAMSVEDMCLHFGACNGSLDYAQFKCPECKGAVTTQTILDIHMARSHSIFSPGEHQTLKQLPSSDSNLTCAREEGSERCSYTSSPSYAQACMTKGYSCYENVKSSDSEKLNSAEFQDDGKKLVKEELIDAIQDSGTHIDEESTEYNAYDNTSDGDRDLQYSLVSQSDEDIRSGSTESNQKTTGPIPKINGEESHCHSNSPVAGSSQTFPSVTGHSRKNPLANISTTTSEVHEEPSKQPDKVILSRELAVRRDSHIANEASSHRQNESVSPPHFDEGNQEGIGVKEDPVNMRNEGGFFNNSQCLIASMLDKPANSDSSSSIRCPRKVNCPASKKKLVQIPCEESIPKCHNDSVAVSNGLFPNDFERKTPFDSLILVNPKADSTDKGNAGSVLTSENESSAISKAEIDQGNSRRTLAGVTASISDETRGANTESEETPAVPKKRGRPRKAAIPIKIEQGDGLSTYTEQADDSWEGTAEILVSNEIDEGNKAVEETEAPRKRGRPRKSVAVEEDSSPAATEQLTEKRENNAAKRKRGRPHRRGEQEFLKLTPGAPNTEELGPRVKRRVSYWGDDMDDDILDPVKIELSDSEEDKPISNRVTHRKKRKTCENKDNSEILCGKCGETFPYSEFSQHNIYMHNGLAWKEGEEPPDFNNEQVMVRLLRDAHKICKVFRCELCQNSKKSVFGFLTHIRMCGKTEEEKVRMHVQCELCGRSVKPYSMPMHMRSVHGPKAQVCQVYIPAVNEQEQSVVSDMQGKRKSAVKAASRLKDALSAEEICVYFTKGSTIPTLGHEVTSKWRKEMIKFKRATCIRSGCKIIGPSVSFAIEHFFNCSVVPNSYYQCLMCAFCTTEKESATFHATQHVRGELSMTGDVEDYGSSTDVDADDKEDEERDNQDVEDEFGERIVNVKIEGGADSGDDGEMLSQLQSQSPKKKWKRGMRSDELRDESKREHGMRRDWALHENLNSNSGCNVYRSAFVKEYNRQINLPIGSDPFPTLHTSRDDWVLLNYEEQKKYLPKLSNSLDFICRKNLNVTESMSLQLFDSNVYEGTWNTFVGGPVHAMVWCPVGIRTIFSNPRQYLAVSVSRLVDDFLRLTSHKRTPTVLQIWDMGLSYETQEVEKPRMVLGVATDFGDALSLSWSPRDMASPSDIVSPKDMTITGTEHLSRLGLLAATFEDGGARIFSLCNPKALYKEEDIDDRYPIYSVHHVVELVRFGHTNYDACVRLTWGNGYIVCAGYKSGNIAIWNLSVLSSIPSRLSTVGKTTVVTAIRTFKPYNNPISTLTLCPSNEKLLIASGNDRTISFWDISQPLEPYRTLTTGFVERALWLQNWPSFLFTSEDTTLTFDCSLDLRWRKQHTSCTANITDFSFSDWTFVTCFATDAGEIFIRHCKDPFIEISKSKTKDNLLLCNLEVRKVDNFTYGEKQDVGSYTEAVETNAKLLFIDFPHRHRGPSQYPKYCDPPSMAAYPLTTVNKVALNPNYRHFDKVAAGYQCGMLRMIRLRHNELELKDYFAKCQSHIQECIKSKGTTVNKYF